MLSISLIDEASLNGCRLKVACSDLEIDFKTFNRWKRSPQDQRRGPNTAPGNKIDLATREKIISISTSKEYQDDSPWIIVAKLADTGRYIASESTFYKVLKENKLLAHRGKSRPPSKVRPSPLVALAPNQIWSWDITYLQSMIRGAFFFLYLFMDIFSRKIVGFDIFAEESMEHSAAIVERIAKDENICKDQLILHSDNGGPMKGATMLATLQKLGVAISFSRPKVSDDNPYSEALFKTLKYVPHYPDVFRSIDEAKAWVIKFIDWYNNHHLHSGIKFVTPSDRHLGLDDDILSNRKEIYLQAKEAHPERWGKKKIRNWNKVKKVYLNHLQEKKHGDIAVEI